MPFWLGFEYLASKTEENEDIETQYTSSLRNWPVQVKLVRNAKE